MIWLVVSADDELTLRETVLMATCRFESIEICAQFVSHERLWDTERHADPQGYEDARRLPWVQCKRLKKVLLRLSIDPE